MIKRFASRVLVTSSIVSVVGIAAAAIFWEPYHEIAATVAYLGIVVSAVFSLLAIEPGDAAASARRAVPESSRRDANDGTILTEGIEQ